MQTAQEPQATQAALSTTIKLSVIIPVGPNEEKFGPLVNDLQNLSEDSSEVESTEVESTEVIIVTCQGIEPLLDQQDVNQRLANHKVTWLESHAGRARQMNEGAAKAAGEFLWFLHLDSRYSASALAALLNAISNNPKALLYFQLAWLNPCPWYLKLNALGANIRSKVFGTPFGDQGFCLSKELFEQVGRYSEDALYGEDHLLTWQVRQHGFKLQSIKAELKTSPRKYQQKGWVKLTCLYQWLWIKQAVPEILKWLNGRN